MNSFSIMAIVSESGQAPQQDLQDIDTLVFDYGGVVSFHHCEPWQGNLARLLNTTPREVRNLLSETSLWGRDFRLGKMSREQFWGLICEKTGVQNVNIQELEYNWANSYQIDIRMVNLIRELRGKIGLQVGILSNSDLYRRNHIEESYQLSAKVDFNITSCDHGVVKPEKIAYEKMLEVAGRTQEPNRVLYVDDRERNVAPAVALGMKGYVFTDYESFIKDWNEKVKI